jgi:hypothetical protein
MVKRAFVRALPLTVLALLVPACSQGSGSNSDSASQATQAQVPDFHLVDLNSISATFNKSISPRDYLGQTPAFYFTHAD